MRGTLPRGGTVLGTRRGSPFDAEHGVAEVQATFEELGLDGLIVIGGNGTLTVAHRLYAEHGLPIVGVPKTIDNDIVGTDVTFGFNTAVQIATDAIDRLHTTAESHDRVMVVEVMGRHSGWIATHAGIAGGATVVLIPEIPFDIDELCDPADAVVTNAAGTPRSWSSPKAPNRSRARSRWSRSRTTGSVTCCSAAWPPASPRRSGNGPASTPVSCNSATSSAAARRPPTTGVVDAVRRRRDRRRPRPGLGTDDGPAWRQDRTRAVVDDGRQDPARRRPTLRRRRRTVLRLTRGGLGPPGQRVVDDSDG